MDHDDFERKAARTYARVAQADLDYGFEELRKAFLAGCSYVRAQSDEKRNTLGFELSDEFYSALIEAADGIRRPNDRSKKTAGAGEVALCFDRPPEYGYYESFYPYRYIFLRVPKGVLQKQLKIGDLITVNYSNWPFPTFYIGTVKFAIQFLDDRKPGSAVEIKAVPVLPADELRRLVKAAAEKLAKS